MLRIHTRLSADVRFPPRTRRHLMSYLNAGRCAVRAWEFDSTEKWTLRNLLAAVGGTSFFVVTQQKTARLSTFDIFHPPSSGQWHTNVCHWPDECIPSRKFHPEIMINNQQFTSHREHCFRFQFSRKLTYMHGFQVINKFITLLIYWFSRIFDVYVKLFTELSFHFRSTHQNLAFTQNIWWTGQLASSAVLRSVVNGGGYRLCMLHLHYFFRFSFSYSYILILSKKRCRFLVSSSSFLGVEFLLGGKPVTTFQMLKKLTVLEQ